MMGRIIIIVFLLIVFANCKQVNKEKKEPRERNVTESEIKQNEKLNFCELLASKAALKNIKVFDLDKLNLYEENISENLFRKVDSVFIKKYLQKSNLKIDFNTSEIYFYSNIENRFCNSVFLVKSCSGSCILKLIYVNFEGGGKIISSFLLAQYYKYPGGFEGYHSELVNDTIVQYKITRNSDNYIEEEERYYSIIDSITKKYTINNIGLFENISYDSIRYNMR